MVYVIDDEGNEIMDFDRARVYLKRYRTGKTCEHCKLPLVHNSDVTISKEDKYVCLNNSCSSREPEIVFDEAIMLEIAKVDRFVAFQLKHGIPAEAIFNSFVYDEVDQQFMDQYLELYRKMDP
ncbi:hypothetical protein ACFQI7_28205 [Paenibacillus allorhizosphaerae]|uniref:Uncharacterized protein n=1 Tax=Paenibacillus allorhizosphaerae TaxID=2849866 RepID=A0ABM8VNG7_9BACL|nr:hypothetical protein [Paenibacillus allorhizosphaerae]CAG7651443.1 hypothetical protein PAECIP111802_04966 [Paenibacillus allorhizosphaerae]